MNHDFNDVLGSIFALDPGNYLLTQDDFLVALAAQIDRPITPDDIAAARQQYNEARAWFLASTQGRLPIHGPRKPRSLEPIDSLPDARWHTRDDGPIKISQMEDSHLVWSYLMYHRQHPTMWQWRKGLAMACSRPDDMNWPHHGDDLYMDPKRAGLEMREEMAAQALRAHIARRKLWKMVVSRIERKIVHSRMPVPAESF